MPSATIEEIGPERAKQLLERNVHNRDLRSRMVTRYADAMKRGEWRFNGATIVLDHEGNVLDGAHRLSAVVQADMPIELIVVAGVDPEAQETIDMGVARTLGDKLALRGEKNSKVLAATLNWLWRYDHAWVMGQTVAPTHQQALELLERNEELRFSLPLAAAVRKEIHVNEGLLGALHYAGKRVDADTTKVFFDRLQSGAELSEGDPVLALRNRLIQNALEQLPRKRLSRFEVAAYIIKAWGMHHRGERVKKVLFFRGRGRGAEPFPRFEDVKKTSRPAA